MNHFQRYLAEEFVEDYAEGRLSRRQALKLIASITGSLLLAEGFLAACAPPPAATATPAAANTVSAANTNTPAAAASNTAASDTQAPAATESASATAEPSGEDESDPPGLSATAAAVGTVLPEDPAIVAGPVQFPGADAVTLLGYLARPAGGGPYRVVLVCHENRGLTAHIEDVTRRLAKAGFMGLAVDLLSRAGGSAAVGQDNAPGQLSALSPDQYVADFRSGWEYTATLAEADAARLGMVGFCFGGGVTWQVATHMPELKAAVPFYGPQPPADDVPNLQAAVLAIYGELDQRIDAGIPAIEAAMQANGKIFEKRLYAGADHAFHNDTGTRYNADAAHDAWARTLAWFDRYL